MKSPTEKASAPSAKVLNFLPRTAEVIIVDEHVKFDGNIIPHTWLHRITTENGRADVIACMVLAEIVYWYRGADVISGGKIVGRKRKFDGDYLQKSYTDLAEKLNLTKGQVSAAVIRLEAKNLVKRDFRTLHLRGVKMSNVLFIQLLAWPFVEISKPIAPTAETADESGPGGYANKSGDLPKILEGGYPGADDTSAGPVADKYREYAKVHTPDYVPGKETSTAAESAEPTPPESFLISEGGTDPVSSEPGSIQTSERKRTSARSPVQLHGDCPPRDSEVNDVDHIRPVLEKAFRGQKFSDREKRTLQSYIADGRITAQWAEAFLMAKTDFDQERARFKEKNVFIPVKPSYLVNNFDRTTDGILSILNEKYIIVERVKSERCSEDLASYFQLFREYDHYFTQVHRGQEVNGRFVARPGHESDFAEILLNHRLFVHYEEGDPVPPAWLRILYAHQRGVYGDELRLALLTKAQAELQANPTGLEALPESLSDEQIKILFELDADSLRDRWANESPRWEATMEKLQTLIAAVTEIKALDDDAAALIGI